MTRMLIIGPPGSGKGTQADRIARHLGIVPVSTGEIFRGNVKNLTPMGIEAKRYIDNGNLVPDSMTNAMVRDRLQEDDVRDGFLLDGYPRTARQVAELDHILASRSQALATVIHLVADEGELVRRLLKRATSEGRSDDSEVVIRRRLRLYQRETEPLLDSYAERGVLVLVDGRGSVDGVTKRAFAAVQAKAVR